MKVRLDESEGAEVQMGPLMDMVFILLIFFIVIAVTKKSIKELNIQLPPPAVAVSENKPKDKDLVIRVTQDGLVWVGDTQVQQQGLLDRIRDYLKDDKATHKVRFEIDKRAQFQHLYPIWDQLKHYGLTDWGFRTTMETGN